MKIPLLCILPVALLATICSCGPKASPEKLTVLDSTDLSYQTAKAYVKNYERHAGIVDSMYTDETGIRFKKKPDSRAIWFSLKRLQAIVQQISQEKGDGVRFYLASYDTVYAPGLKGIPIPPRQYWGYNTLVMVSTKDSLNGRFHRDYYTQGGNGKGIRGFIRSVGEDPENRGEMCPPPSNCDAIGATLIGQ